MTLRFLIGTYAAGYSLNGAKYSGLEILSSARVGGAGVVCGAPAYVINAGSVQATNTNSDGIELFAGGFVANGSPSQTAPLISGVTYGVVALYAPAAVANYATIQASGNAGVFLRSGGVLTNGSSSDATALINGKYAGVVAGAAQGATVTNFGTIKSLLGAAISFQSSSDRLVAEAGSTWLGTVQGGGGTPELANGTGTITHLASTGSLSGAEAMSFGGFASYVIDTGGAWTLVGGNSLTLHQSLQDGGALTNLGELFSSGGDGVILTPGGAFTNGSQAATGAVIEGQIGAYAGATGAATVTNFGSLYGSGGVAVEFKSAADRLVAENGSTWRGVAQGGGGTLELASGTGTLTGLGATGTLSGAEALTFSGFGAYVVDAGSAWTLAGADNLAYGQRLTDGGAITNLGALTSAGKPGGYGNAALFLGAGATVTNGSAVDTTASISGAAGGVHTNTLSAATVVNFGTIRSVYDHSPGFRDTGVYLSTGTVTNGSTTDTTALISGGYYGVHSAEATVTNFGTIRGDYFSIEMTSASDRLVVEAGSTWIGEAKGKGGTIEMASGTGTLSGVGGTGTVSGAEALTFAGFGSYVIDTGSAWTLTGSDSLASGQKLTIGGALTNLGALADHAGNALVLAAGGALTNGSATATTALISGQFGVFAQSAPATVVNFGTIDASESQGVDFADGGAVTNLGAILSPTFIGVELDNAGSVVNGALSNGAARIAGENCGVLVKSAGATVTNFGTLSGNIYSVVLDAASDRLVAEAGSTWIAAARGAGGALELASGTGTLTGLGSTGMVSGAEAMTFSGFGTYIMDAGSAWTLTGANSLASSQSLSVAGKLGNLGTLAGAAGDAVVLTAGGSLTNGAKKAAGGLISGVMGVYAGAGGTGVVTNFGTIEGTGGVAVQFRSAGERLVAESGSTWIGAVAGGGGTLDLANGTGTVSGIGSTGTVSVAEAMTFSGFGTYEFAKGAWSLTGADSIGAGQSMIVKAKVTSTGALTVNGAISSTGSLTIAAGTAAFDSGASLTVASLSLTGGVTSLNEALAFKGTFSEGSAATLTLGAGDKLTLSGSTTLAGVINGAGSVSAASATLKALVIGGTDALVIAAAAIQAGAITIGDGASSAATRTVAKTGALTIAGAFAIGEGAGATSSLTVAGALTKAGTTGTSRIAVAVTDSGLVEAADGTLDLTSAVSGSGALKIDAGAVLEVDAATSKSLTTTFDGAGATLALKTPTAFASTIAGFGVGDTFDLLKIAATGASINARDQLVIVDGTTTVATLQLTGTYSGATFAVGADGHGGTDLSLTAAGAVRPSAAPSVQALICAMAGLGGSAGMTIPGPDPRAIHQPLLANPRLPTV